MSLGKDLGIAHENMEEFENTLAHFTTPLPAELVEKNKSLKPLGLVWGWNEFAEPQLYYDDEFSTEAEADESDPNQVEN